MKVREIRGLLEGKYRIISAKNGRLLEKRGWKEGFCDDCEIRAIWSDIEKTSGGFEPFVNTVVMMYVSEAEYDH